MLNVKKCMCWHSSIIELKNARWNIEIRSLNKFDIISLFRSYICRYSISPGFPGTVLVLWVLKDVFRCHAKLVSGRRLSRIFLDHKNTTFLRTPRYILTLPPWENTSTNRKDHDRERKMCRLVIIECGMRLRRMRKGYVNPLAPEFPFKF